ncbi:PTS glucose transporter subunit IIA [Pseudonocardiaceae bacterium YIM PH 21723]|nr:PTS glucose transporter subunit IIA [Pseudonocardiaceae bacterium YIM PH 21723]
MMTSVLSPVSGTVLPLSEVPDPVFAQAMVGPGVALKPVGGSADVIAPIAGVIVTLHPHAFVIAGESGTAVLVHLGIDTVQRQGEGFALHVAKGDTVTAGQSVVTWDPTEIEAVGFSSVCPVIVLEATEDQLADLVVGSDVTAGDPLFTHQS